MAINEPNTPASAVVSPKVIAAATTQLVLIVVIAAIGAVTPDLFAFLGAWAPVAYAAVVGLGGALAGYLKSDPRRV